MKEIKNKKLSETRKRLFAEGKIKAPWLGKHRSEELKEKVSKANKGNQYWKLRKPFSEETKQKMRIKKLGISLSEEHKKKLSEITKGKTYEELYGKEVAMSKRKKMSVSNIGKHFCTEEMKQIHREIRKTIKMPHHHTKPELKFEELCKKYDLPYKYTGDSGFWIGNVNPDFVNCNGLKTAVEIFGDYWHNREDMKAKDVQRLKTLKEFGWKRIIIWEHELMKNCNEQEIIKKLEGLE